ncbi:fucose 4-O-acetylase-like acetyltransferase [Larkinella arboricola]|uniref:Fucose 4-O-acetylase-like acetyltransferase n=1 Tax=Larkinella arboricola TaxID=643671 RepID=A0A327WP99_LARAB|nr:acyltransferase family protein [Larkinella arboricola]RAJ93028.1 fucose 4-O-acetylase-like acetyltransferase [Larkinella arboricola]
MKAVLSTPEVHNRIDYIDITKGIGILFVVFGHVGFLGAYAFMFHMPLFFFVAGMLFWPRKDEKSYFTDKAIQLLVPYTVYLLLIYGFQLYVEFQDKPLTLENGLKAIGKGILGSRWLGGYTTVFWFIPCFFLVQQLTNGLLNRVNPKRILGLMGLLLLLSYLDSLYLQPIRVPWNINVTLAAIPIFYAGYAYSKKEWTVNVFFVILGSFVACALVYKGYHNTYDMKNAYYGIPVLTLLSSICMILLIIWISRALSETVFLSSLFPTLGRASLTIMYLHEPIQSIVAEHWTQDKAVRIVMAVGLPVIVYQLQEKTVLTRALFLGSRRDFKLLFQTKKELVNQQDRVMSSSSEPNLHAKHLDA